MYPNGLIIINKIINHHRSIIKPKYRNVHLERETLALARVQLQYKAGVELLRNEVHMLQSAINEGK